MGDPAQTQGDQTLADLIFNAEITDKPVEADDQQDEQKATIEELASVLLNPEEIPRDSKREFAKNLYRSFRSCQTFMSILCRFPIISFENEDHSIVFEYNWNSCRGGLFFITLAILVLLTVLSSCNIVSTMLNFPNQPNTLEVNWDVRLVSSGPGEGLPRWEPILGTILDYPKRAAYINTTTIKKSREMLRAEEMFFFRRNLASLLIILFLMYHIIFADINL